MAKKVKCDSTEMLSWMSVAKQAELIQPDPSKITLAQLKNAVKTVFNDGEGCYSKPVGGGAEVRGLKS